MQPGLISGVMRKKTTFVVAAIGTALVVCWVVNWILYLRRHGQAQEKLYSMKRDIDTVIMRQDKPVTKDQCVRAVEADVPGLGTYVDPWGSPFRFLIIKWTSPLECVYVLRCAGGDRVFDTEDDIAVGHTYRITREMQRKTAD